VALNADEPALYEAIGRFVTAFASAEAGVHLIARKLSGLDDEIGRALFKGMRLTDMIERVRALLRIEPEDRSRPAFACEAATIVEACLTQLVLISGQRHNLVHRVTGCGASGIFVTNVLNSKSYDNAEFETYTLTELMALTSDCQDIFYQFDRLAAGNRLNETLKVGVPEWQYKPG
jgi:hypothetical protein